MKNNYILHLHISYILYNFAKTIEKQAKTLTEGQGGGKARISIAVHEQSGSCYPM